MGLSMPTGEYKVLLTQPNMTFEEAREFCIKAIALAAARDGSSGGAARVMRINKDGMFREFIDYKDLPYGK